MLIKSGATYKHFLVNVRQDYCKHYTGESISKLIDISFHYMAEFSNIHEMKCPVENGTIFKIENAYTNNVFKDVIVAGDYGFKVSFEILFNQKFLRIVTMELYVSFKLVADRKKQKKLNAN